MCVDARSTFSQGKTDVAMLTILRVIDQHRLPSTSTTNMHIRQTIDRDAFKIIYVWVTSYPTFPHFFNKCQGSDEGTRVGDRTESWQTVGLALNRSAGAYW